MKTLLFLIALCAAGYYFYNNGLPGTGPKVKLATDGATLTVGLENGGTATHKVGQDFEDTYLLIGASEGCNDSRGSCGSLSVLPLGVATGLARRYPDFRRCASAGAHEAKANVRSLQLVVPDRKTGKVLHELTRETERRVQQKGEWMCVAVSGTYVDFVQAELGGAVVTAAEVNAQIPAYATKQVFVLSKKLAPLECPPLS